MQIRQKWIGMGGIAIAMIVILSQFQNCAPVGTEVQSSSGDSPEMRVIEDWSTPKVNIINKVVQALASENTVDVEGFCDRHLDSHEPMRWQISVPQAGEAIMAGAVGCEGGGFRVQISELNQLRCGTVYSFEVSTLNGETDQAVLIRKCAL